MGLKVLLMQNFQTAAKVLAYRLPHSAKPHLRILPQRGEGFSMKRILSIQDISCLGRCSQTIALPVLSAMGVEVTVLPTAVLSTHTGFLNPVVRDLSDLIVPAAEHWQREGVRFDAIYTGYLGSAEVADAVQEAIRLLRGADTRMFVDPVMGDHGRLYARLDEDYVHLSEAFCGQADVIVPNLTEACLLTGTAYREEWTEAELRELLRRLSSLGPGEAVLTGVSLSAGRTGVLGYRRSGGTYFACQSQRIPAAFHGTGDLFASVALGALMRGLPDKKAFQMAADYTALTIARTVREGTEERFGVNFEETLPELHRMLEAGLNQQENAV